MRHEWRGGVAKMATCLRGHSFATDGSIDERHDTATGPHALEPGAARDLSDLPLLDVAGGAVVRQPAPRSSGSGISRFLAGRTDRRQFHRIDDLGGDDDRDL